MTRKQKKWLIQAAAALLLVGGVELLFYAFGINPQRFSEGNLPLAYPFLLSFLYFLDVPILSCIAGYRKWTGALFGYGIAAAAQLPAMKIFGAPFYGMALLAENWLPVLWILAMGNLALTLGAYYLGHFLRRRGWGLSAPGEH